MSKITIPAGYRMPLTNNELQRAIELIHQAGGLAVLAHPGLLHAALPHVLTHSFDGIEVYHPKNRGRYEEFLAVAEEKGWYVSGGSDFHGTTGRYPEQVGVFSFDSARIEPLLQYKKK